MKTANKKRKNKWIGRAVILWSWRADNEAYKDQMGISRGGRIVLEEIRVKIFSIRPTDSEGGGYRSFFLKARSKDGRVFTHRTSNTGNVPKWFQEPLPPERSSGNEPMVDLLDACAAFNDSTGPFVTPDGQKKVPEADLMCLRHGKVLLRNSVEQNTVCYDCARESIRKLGIRQRAKTEVNPNRAVRQLERALPGARI